MFSIKWNRRIPNGTYGGVRGRSREAPPTRCSVLKEWMVSRKENDDVPKNKRSYSKIN